MLTAIREGSKGWIAGTIIGLIVLTFALFGISSYLEGGTEIPVATVNGEEISSYTYQNQLAQQQQSLAASFGSSFDVSMLDTLGIRERVLDNLIESNLLNQYTTDSNFRLTDEQLARQIRQNDLFQTEGKFDPELYQNLLSSNRLTPQGYEALERQNSMNRQLQEAIADSAFSVDAEINKLLALQTQRRIVQYAMIPHDQYVEEFEISDADARAEYDDNIDAYQSESRIKVEYIELSVERISEGLEITDDALQQTYELIKGRLKTAEVRKASHILFGTKADAEDEEKLTARELAESVLQQVRDGADFAELAETHSDDPGSAANGGDLGIVTRGQMVKPFEDAVFAMQQGEISEIVETQFGLHIIKLTELTEAQQQTLEQAREEVLTETRKLAAEEQFADLVEPFQNLIFEQPDSLAPAADETGLEVQVSEWFTLGTGEGVAEVPAVRQAAFSEQVLDEDLNSQAVEIGFDRMVAVRKLDYEEASARPFDEVKEDIIAKLKLDRSKAKAEEAAKGLVDGLTHLASWDIRLAENELTAAKLAERRSDIEPSLGELAAAIYAAPPPEENRPVYGQVTLQSGGAAVYAFTAAELGDDESADQADRDRLAQQLTNRDGQGLYRQLVNHLRANADIFIDQGQL